VISPRTKLEICSRATTGSRFDLLRLVWVTGPEKGDLADLDAAAMGECRTRARKAEGLFETLGLDERVAAEHRGLGPTIADLAPIGDEIYPASVRPPSRFGGMWCAWL
jgi:hypothetical protein